MNESFSFGNFVWWVGVVEDRDDPEMLGRVRVRVFGYHTEDTGELPTENLMWATVMHPTTSAAVSGVGQSTGLVPGSHVFGFFMDGQDAQTPIVMGSIPGKASKASNSSDNSGINSSNATEVLKDPVGLFPKYTNEPDVNRLSRNQNIDKTINKLKIDSLSKAVSMFNLKLPSLPSIPGLSGLSFPSFSWQEPMPSYQAKYPFNHVYESESGHVQEYDDTPGHERIHTYHKSGSFQEIQPDGTKVTKVVKDNYSIVAGDDYIQVTGNVNISITGDANVMVAGNANMEIAGNMSQKVGGNASLEVGGNYDVRVGGSHTDIANGNRKINAIIIDLN